MSSVLLEAMVVLSQNPTNSEYANWHPFQTDRRLLYTSAELLSGFSPDAPSTLAQTPDYQIYRYWVSKGRYKPDRHEATLQCLHDNSITYALAHFIERRKVVGIMGGHDIQRDSDLFAKVSFLARSLTKEGFLVASGGGPGVMEAAHFGSLFAAESDMQFVDAQNKLAAQSVFPADAGTVVNKRGVVNQTVLSKLAEWITPAIALRKSVATPCESLGIPTWRYGHEPTAVFATHIAKYFENSVREDGLLSIASSGIVYAQGGAGTLQEVFQSAVFNAYSDVDRGPSPMIFLGTDFWERSGALTVLRGVLGQESFKRYVTCTDDDDEIRQVLLAFSNSNLNRSDYPRTKASSLPVLGITNQTGEEEIGRSFNIDVR